MNTISSTQTMTGLQTWWDRRSTLEKWLLGTLGCAALSAGIGALVYAIVTGGVVVASGGSVVTVGKAATIIAAGLA